MKWSFSGAAIIIAGLIGLSIMLLFQNITTNNESDYYLLKEVTEAAMIDAVDVAYYRGSGEVKIIEQKFVENFIRRFSEVASLQQKGYTIQFYDIMEVPPKASVRIKSTTNDITLNTETSDFDIVNELTAILETRITK